jgi:hypothetical protein
MSGSRLEEEKMKKLSDYQGVIKGVIGRLVMRDLSLWLVCLEEKY